MCKTLSEKYSSNLYWEPIGSTNFTNPEKINKSNTGSTGSSNQPEKADMKKLTRKDRRTNQVVKADPELTIDLEKVQIIPSDLTGANLRKYKRDNPNAITQEEYERLVKKQTQNNLAGQGNTGGST